MDESDDPKKRRADALHEQMASRKPGADAPSAKPGNPRDFIQKRMAEMAREEEIDKTAAEKPDP